MYDIFEKGLAISFSLLILGQAYCVRQLVGTWLFPACIFSLFWFAYTFVPLVLLMDVPSEPAAIAFILLCVTCFSISSLLFDWRHAFTRNAVLRASVEFPYNNAICRSIFFFSVSLSILLMAINSQVQGITVTDIVLTFFASSERYAQLRYSDQLNVNVFGQLSLVFAYLGVVFGGLVYSTAAERRRGWMVVAWAFVPSVLVMLTQSAKGSFFLSVVLFYSAYLVCKIQKNKFVLLDIRTVVKGGVVALFALPVVLVSFLSRGLYESHSIDYVVRRLVRYMASYSSSQVYAFSDWFSYYIGNHAVLNYAAEKGAGGFYTFMAMFRWFGSDREVPQGVYDEYFYYGDLLDGNIYTIFRGLIQDFGIGGAFVYMLLSGVLFHWVYFILLTSRRPVFSVATFIFMVAYFYMSWIISFLIWDSIYVSFFVIAMALLANRICNSKVLERVRVHGESRLFPS